MNRLVADGQRKRPKRDRKRRMRRFSDPDQLELPFGDRDDGDG
jgi:hypothetical protein